MTVDRLSMIVGTHAAANLVALKSRLGDTPDERAAERINSLIGPGLRVSVVKVSLGYDDTLDYVELDCGHATLIDHDDDNASLVGAETSCDRSHK